ncbi:hypothetical protein [Thalassospira lohafexi]|uniref:Uncharacterized protein n=1 Tax=Thalassospira lohafexi TaxID=744227 RepID=A0A2N3L3Q5_9PROT|nr:hypothetical protein [Thalassospira lohafexi]PKR57469.1 hypothetical protein COO92_16135 [Thalassospira lohafexi]
MTQPTFDSHVTAYIDIGSNAKAVEHIKGDSYRHNATSQRPGVMVMTLEMGGATYQCADPNWFHHLIDQANAALTSAGYPPHITASNDDDADKKEQVA